MSRAKKHVATKKELVAKAGSFCNAALLAPLPAADLAIVNEALEEMAIQRPSLFLLRVSISIDVNFNVFYHDVN